MDYENTHHYPWLAPLLESMGFEAQDSQSAELEASHSDSEEGTVLVRWWYNGLVTLKQLDPHRSDGRVVYYGKLLNQAHLLDLFKSVGWQLTAPALPLLQETLAADFGRFSNDLENRLPDAFTNAIGLLEQLNKEDVARRLQSVAAGWFKELKELRAAALPLQYKQERPAQSASVLPPVSYAGADFSIRVLARGEVSQDGPWFVGYCDLKTGMWFLGHDNQPVMPGVVEWQLLPAAATPVATAEPAGRVVTGEMVDAALASTTPGEGPYTLEETLDFSGADTARRVVRAALEAAFTTPVATVGSEPLGAWVKKPEGEGWISCKDEMPMPATHPSGHPNWTASMEVATQHETFHKPVIQKQLAAYSTHFRAWSGAEDCKTIDHVAFWRIPTPPTHAV